MPGRRGSESNDGAVKVKKSKRRSSKIIEMELEKLLTLSITNDNEQNDDDEIPTKSSSRHSSPQRIKNKRETEDRGDRDSLKNTSTHSKEKRSSSRKIKYNRDDDDPSSLSAQTQTNNSSRDTDENKSVKSNKSGSARSHKSRSIKGHIAKESSSGDHNDRDEDTKSTRSKETAASEGSRTSKDSKDSFKSFASSEERDSKLRSPRPRTKERRKIKHNNKEAGTPESAEDRDRDGKSVRSKSREESARSRNKSSSSSTSSNAHRTSRSKSKSNRGNDDSPGRDRGSNKSSAGSRPRSSKKISYRKDAPESAQERDKDARSNRSRNSTRSRKSTQSSVLDKSSLHESLSKGKVKRLDQEKEFLEDLGDWSSEDEEIGLNDGVGRVEDNPTRSRERQRGSRRRYSSRDQSGAAERRKRPLCSRRGGSLGRSIAHEGASKVNNNDEDNESLGKELNSANPRSAMRFSSRRPARKVSAVTGEMVLGDPSRRAPPSRSKSTELHVSDSMVSGDLSRNKAPPGRSHSNDFAAFLRQEGLQNRPDLNIKNRRPLRDDNSLENANAAYLDDKYMDDKEEEDEEDDNPFEITYQSNNNSNNSSSNNKSLNNLDDTWDPFSQNTEEEVDLEEVDSSSRDRRDNLVTSNSGGFLQASMKDTLSRGKFAKNNHEEKKAGHGAKSEREKQRRAEYKKSIAAATLAGGTLRPQSTTTRQRQVKNTKKSSGKNVRKLEDALEARFYLDHGDQVNAARLIISTGSKKSELVVHRGTRRTRKEEVKLVYSSDTFSVTNATLTSKYQTIAKHRGVNLDQEKNREVVVITFRPKKNGDAININAQSVANAYSGLLQLIGS